MAFTEGSYRPGGPCMARTLASGDHQTFNPAVLLKPLVQAKEMGQETVNGLQTRHYVMPALQKGATRVSGEAWIADPGGFVVKYALSVRGREDYFGQGRSGEQSMAYELHDSRSIEPVAVPEGCPPPVTDLPAMSGATDVQRSLSQLSYNTTAGLAETAAFYEEQMKGLGWELETSSGPSSAAPMPSGGVTMPTMPPLPNVPGVDLRKYLPTAQPAPVTPATQDGWLIFANAKFQERAYLYLQPQGTSLKMQVRIVQE